MGRRKELQYDGLGRLEAVTLPNPNTGAIDAGALVTRYGYDEVGNKLTQTDALGRVTSWTYDVMGRELTRTLPLGQVEAFAYDDAGQRTVHVDFKGVTTRYGYDLAGRMNAIDYATDANVFTTYTPSGQRESVTDGQGTTLYTYTARDQLASVAYPDGNTITYAYDAAGNKTELHSAALDQVYRYDELNRLKAVESRTLGGAVRTNAFEYDEVGNRKLRVAADGTTTTYGYDVRNRLRTLATRSAAGAMLLAAVYTVDDSGLRIGIAESNAAGPTRNVGYAYDGVKRLTAEVIQRPGQSGHSVSYEYDAVGNRLRRVTNGAVTTYTVDANDRLTHETEAGVTTLRTYDENGNTTYQSKPGELVEYGYDEANRLTRTVKGNVTALNVYNADGIRHLEVRDSIATTWVIDPNRDYAQTLEAYRGGQLATVWQYGDDLMAQANVVGGSVVERSLLADGMGSVRQATDASGSVTDSFEYDAFGEELVRIGTSDIDHRYRGEQVDPNTGFYNLRARWYDSSIGSFLSLDAWRGEKSDPQSLHKYLYAHADPVNGSDPSGYERLDGLAIAINWVGRAVTSASYRATAFYLGAARTVSIATGGVSYIVTRGRAIMPELANTYRAGTISLQAAYSPVQPAITQAQSAAAQHWQSHGDMIRALNQTIGNSRVNPANIQWHHIVEQWAPNLSRFSPSSIHSMANIVPVSTRLHQTVISPYYSTALRINGQYFSHARDYIQKLPFERQYEIGLNVVRQALTTGRIDPSQVPL